MCSRPLQVWTSSKRSWCRCKKAGHKIYSPMLQRDVIFNHHNPMIPADYDFLISCVHSFQQLLKGWTPRHLQCISDQDFVLFLLFNLERRVELQDTAVLELFEELARHSTLRFRLLVVKVLTKATTASEDKPQERLLMQRKVDLQELYVHELRCLGSHDGWRFSDEADLRLLERIIQHRCPEFRLFAGAPTADPAKCGTAGCPYLCTWLSGHCCHRCKTTGSHAHGPRCDLALFEEHEEKAKQKAEKKAVWGGPVQHTSTQGGLGVVVPRADRFRKCLSLAQQLQQQRPKSLQLQTSALRRLERCLIGEPDAPEPKEPLNAARNREATGCELLGHPIQEGPSWRLWCPLEANLVASLELLRATLFALT